MKLIDPWQNIDIHLLKNDKLQFLDNNIHLIYVLVGEVSVKTSEKYFVLQKNDFFIVPKLSACELEINKLAETKAFEITLNYFFETKSDEAHEYQFSGNSADQPQATDAELIEYINTLLRSYLFQNQSDTAIFSNYFSIIDFVERNYRRKVEVKSKRSVRQEVEELKVYIDNNYDEDIHLEDLAQKLWISEQYLSRLFSETTGSTFSDYLTSKRLEAVKTALRQTDTAIIDIAFDAGFTNISSFNRIFKKNVGQTPSEYRKNNVQNPAKAKVEESDAEDFSTLKHLFENQNQNDVHHRKITFSAQENEKEPKIFSPQYLINLGDVESLLSHTMANQIKGISDKLPFKYGRIWNVLSRAVVGEVEMRLDFSKVDQALDLLVSNRLIPFLELGFKGKSIHETMTHLIKNEPFQPYRSLEEYKTVIEIFIKHCIHRYGSLEVSRWIFEVWKPDNLVLETLQAEDLAEVPTKTGSLDITHPRGYIAFFAEIKTLIQSLSPESEVGGCGISPDISQEDINGLLLQWKNSSVQPDFLSLSFYPMDLIKNDYLSDNTPISPDAHYAAHKIQNFKNELMALNWEIPVYLTEFNITICNRDLINDTAFKGAYILRSVLEVSSTCPIIGYWVYLDEVMHYGDIEMQESFGGAGLISQSGIPKAGYYVFEFLGKMTGQICYQSRDLLIIKDLDNRLKILATNYSHLNAAYYYNPEGSYKAENIYSIFQETPTRQLEIQIPKDYMEKDREILIKEKRIGKAQGSFIEEVAKMNAFDNLNPDEIDYLKKRCIPEQLVSVQDFRKNQTFLVTLQAHEVVYTEISLLNFHKL